MREFIGKMFGNAPKAETPYPRTKSFEYFDHPRIRHTVYEFSKELTTYLEKNDIKNILFIDRGARPAWVGVDEYWKEHYPDKQRPDIFFTNPDAFDPKLKDVIDKTNFLATILGGSLNVDAIEDAVAPQAEEFSRVYEQLMEEKDQPLVLFDTCSHSGKTIIPILAVLGQLGFSDVRVLTAYPPNLHSPIRTDADLHKSVKMHTCYPFGVDSLIEKGDGITSDRGSDSGRAKGIMLRHEIREIVRRKGK